MRHAFALCLALAAAAPARAEEAYTLPDDAAAARFVTSNLIAVFYHELGHALIDVLMLPVLGNEEDAADALSALLIDRLRQEEAATVLVRDTALGFRLFAGEAERDGQDQSYWGQHAQDMARYDNLVCLFYGAKPDRRDDLAEDLGLPAERKALCPEEFALAAERWGRMLADTPPQDGGRGLRLVVPPERDDYTRLIAREIESINAEYGLPRWVDVTVETCGEANAFYDLRAKRIVMCIEYARDLERLYESRQRP
jgi:Putative metallopeptidase